MADTKHFSEGRELAETTVRRVLDSVKRESDTNSGITAAASRISDGLRSVTSGLRRSNSRHKIDADPSAEGDNSAAYVSGLLSKSVVDNALGSAQSLLGVLSKDAENGGTGETGGKGVHTGGVRQTGV
jgi:hypothetical protein